MRTELPKRSFPYTCHAVSKPVKPIYAFGLFWGCLAFVLINVVVAQTQSGNQQAAKAISLSFSGFWLCAIAVIPVRAGFRDVLLGRVLIIRRATWVLPKFGSVEQLLVMLAGASVMAAGFFYAELHGWPSVPLDVVDDVTLAGPVIVGLGSCLVLLALWQQLRGIRMTPESITYWRGIGKISLAWDELGDAISTNDVRDHEGYRKHLDRYLPGAKMVVPVERVMDVKLRVRWEDADTPRLLLETNHFMVEPSALLTAILALRDNPELRPLLGTRESKVLFTGPPWRVRRHMYRTQQWWPSGAAPDGIAVDRDGVVKEFQ